MVAAIFEACDESEQAKIQISMNSQLSVSEYKQFKQMTIQSQRLDSILLDLHVLTICVSG